MKTQGEKLAEYVMVGMVITTILLGIWYFSPHSQEYIAGVSKAGRTDMYPDPSLTPGSLNPAVTQDTIAETICNKNWKTGSVRDTQTSPQQKQSVYPEYKVAKPQNNSGRNQICEIDHFVSLELGGSDKLDNLWPQCGPQNVSLNQRYFKEKDLVENYLHKEVCDGSMTLTQAQQEIATDWYAVYYNITVPTKNLGALTTISGITNNDPDDN